jgi:aminopeptidase
MNQQLLQKAIKNVKSILDLSIQFNSSKNKALVIYDKQNGLTEILTAAYRQLLPEAKFVNFDEVSKEEIIAEFDRLSAKDLVVLVQSASFRLDDFRIRIYLFQQKLKTIEHVHLYRDEESVWDVYIDSLEYNKDYYLKHGLGLQKILSQSTKLSIKFGETELCVDGLLETPKLNISDYSEMENVGGTFPIGEVFTESVNLENMNGSFLVYAFANQKFEIIQPEVFRVDIEKGLVAGWSENAPQEFISVIESIKQLERPIVREIGFGLNKAISKTRVLGDITAFERIVGVHLSLGEKHTVYKKEGIQAHKARFHVDLFLQVEKVEVNGQLIFDGHKYFV